MKEKSLYKNSIYFILYRVINVLYPLVTATYVSRILKPEGVGQFSLAQSIVIFLVAVSLLGIPNYGVREISKIKEKNKDTKIFMELFIINAISTTIICFLYYFIVNFLKLSINIKLFNIYGILIVLNYINVDWFYQGKEEFKYITIRSVIVKLISMVAIFIFIKTENDLNKYGLIFVLAYAGNYIFNLINLRKYINFKFEHLELKKHIKSIIMLAITSISNEIYVTVDVVMLSILSNITEIGFYSNSMKITRIIINVCTAIGTAMLPRLSRLKSENKSDEFNDIINNGIKILLWFTIPAVFGLFIISNELVTLLFGNEFINSGKILKFLSLLIIMRTFSNIYMQILLCDNKEHKTSTAYFVGMCFNIVLNSILIIKFSAIGAAISSVLAELLILLILMYCSKNSYKLDISFKFIFQLLISVFTMSVILILLNKIEMLLIFKVLFDVIIGFAIYIIINLILKNDVLFLFISKVLRKKEKRYVIKS